MNNNIFYSLLNNYDSHFDYIYQDRIIVLIEKHPFRMIFYLGTFIYFFLVNIFLLK